MRGENKEVKRRFSFDYTELTAIAEYLESQEEKGLRLKNIEKRKFIFEKAEPRKIRYTADIYKGRFTHDFVNSCKAEGWEFAATYDCLYIFRTEKEDAIDIVTDEQEKYKAVRNRVFLNPKYFGLYFLIILEVILRLFEYPESYSYTSTFLPECDILWWVSLTATALLISIASFQGYDIFLWLYEAKKALKKGEKVRYQNLSEVRKKYQTMLAVTFLLSSVIMLVISFIDSGYATDRSFYWFPGLACIFVNLCILNYAVFRVQDKNKKIRQAVITLIVFVIMIIEPFAVISYNKGKAPAEYEKAPITFEDFGLEGLDHTDTTYVDGTRFAQYYRSRVTYDGKRAEGNYDMELYYEVFVSEYPSVRQKYIDSVLAYNKELEERLSDMGMKVTVTSILNSKWDAHYQIFFENERVLQEIAMKGDTVIYILNADTNGKDFFEVAYEKLSSEKGKGDVTP